MTDVLTPQQRSFNMSRIRSRNTRPVDFLIVVVRSQTIRAVSGEGLRIPIVCRRIEESPLEGIVCRNVEYAEPLANIKSPTLANARARRFHTDDVPLVRLRSDAGCRTLTQLARRRRRRGGVHRSIQIAWTRPVTFVIVVPRNAREQVTSERVLVRKLSDGVIVIDEAWIENAY